MRQDTETFIRCLENGLRHFGGSPLLLNLDNMKAAVLKADWFDPERVKGTAEAIQNPFWSVAPQHTQCFSDST
jgi:transposase